MEPKNKRLWELIINVRDTLATARAEGDTLEMTAAMVVTSVVVALGYSSGEVEERIRQTVGDASISDYIEAIADAELGNVEIN